MIRLNIPRPPGPRPRPGDGPDQPERATRREYTGYELDAIRAGFFERGTRTPCPRCHAQLESRETLVRGPDGRAVWFARCSGCQRNARIELRPARPIRPPTFETLVVSDPKRDRPGRSIGSALLSATVHTGLIAAAVVATMEVAAPAVTERADTNMVFLNLEADRQPEPEPEQPAPTQVVSLNPPPRGFQVVDAPIDVPTHLPPIDLGQRFDPRDYTGIGVEGGVFGGVEGGTGTPDLTQAFLVSAVDEPAEWLSGPPLQYPVPLRQAGIEGFVLLEYVVDTSGVAEPGSIKVVQMTHEGFVPPALDVIRASRFRPARVRGFPVRMLVAQRIDFSLIRRR